MLIGILAKKEYWHLDQVTQCSYRNEKLSHSQHPPPPPPPTLRQPRRAPPLSEEGLQELGSWRLTRGQAQDLEEEKQNCFVPLSFPMEMNILVSCQRKAINISSRRFNSTFKLSDGNWCYLTLSRGSVYTFTFISQLKANFEIAQYRENEIHSAYLSPRKSEPDSRSCLFSIRQSNSFIKLVNNVPCCICKRQAPVNWLTIFTDNTVN